MNTEKVNLGTSQTRNSKQTFVTILSLFALSSICNVCKKKSEGQNAENPPAAETSPPPEKTSDPVETVASVNPTSGGTPDALTTTSPTDGTSKDGKGPILLSDDKFNSPEPNKRMEKEDSLALAKMAHSMSTSFDPQLQKITFKVLPLNSTSDASGTESVLTALENSGINCVNEVLKNLKFQVTDKSTFQLIEGISFSQCMSSAPKSTFNSGVKSSFGFDRNLKILCQNADFTTFNNLKMTDDLPNKSVCPNNAGGELLFSVVLDIKELSSADVVLRQYKRTRAVQGKDGQNCKWDNAGDEKTFSNCLWLERIDTELGNAFFLKTDLQNTKIKVPSTGQNILLNSAKWESAFWNGQNKNTPGGVSTLGFSYESTLKAGVTK